MFQIYIYTYILYHINNKVCVCFVDYENEFDRIDWVKLLDILGNT